MCSTPCSLQSCTWSMAQSCQALRVSMQSIQMLLSTMKPLLPS
jgi:hypothetical protein